MVDLANYGPIITGLVILCLFTGFAFEWRPPEITAGIGVSFLLLTGILTVDDVLSMLSSTALATIAAMFVLSAALVRTGVIDRVADIAVKYARKSTSLTFLTFLFVSAFMSAFMNNTPLVMLMIPVAAKLAREAGIAQSRFLIPLSYAAILGGTCTLIGTSTNLLVDTIARDAGLVAFHIFEIAPLGITATIVGIITIFLLRGLLPDRTTANDIANLQSGKRFIVQAVIEDDSPHIGKHISDVTAFNHADRRIVDVLRGDQSMRRVLNEVILCAGDTVVLSTSVAEVLSLKEEGELSIADNAKFQQIDSRSSSIVEVLIGPGARIAGRTLRHLRLRRRYGIYPMALHRGGMNMADRFETTPLIPGDTLLIEGASEDLSRFAEENRLVNITEPTERGYRRSKAPIAVAITLAVVLGAALNLMSIAGLALIGAVIVLATRCVEVEEAVQSVDWKILGLIFAMLAVGLAMQKTGLAEMIVAAAVPYLMILPPIIALAAIYLMTTILTELVTNNAVAVVVTPIAIALAISLGLDPRPFVVAVMLAASASFITPIGYQTNTLVYNAGGYKFTDFFRLGIIIDLTIFAVGMILIPRIWPLI